MDIDKEPESNLLGDMNIDRPEFFAHKRKYKDDGDEGRQLKKIKAIIALLLNEEVNQNAIKHAMITTLIFPIIDPYIRERLMNDLKALFTSENEHSDDLALPAKDIIGIPISNTYKQAENDPQYANEWMAAIEKEIRSLLKNGTWEEVISPPGTNLISTKWVLFTIKQNEGKLER